MASSTVKTYCAHCRAHCGVICYVRDGVFEKVERDRRHPACGICVKGMAAPELVYHPERLKYPMKRTRPKTDPDPGWVRISWDEALDTIATNLNKIKKDYGPQAVVFGRGAVGGSPAGDYSWWLMRLANAFGSPNSVATTHICNWHKDSGSKYTYGRGIPEGDWENTACILLWGTNPAVSHPIQAIQIAKARRRGAKLIVIDPRKIGLAARADIWLQVRPGSDGALALSMINVMIDEKLYDEEFVRDWTNGPFLIRQDIRRYLAQADLTPGGDGKKFVAWDLAKRGPVSYDAEKKELALLGTYQVKLADGQMSQCKSSFQLLKELVSNYPPERTEEICWVPARKIREAARMFAGTKPACYYSYVGVEEHTNAMQTNRAICILYALTGNFDAKGGNVIFPQPAANPITGLDLLPAETAEMRLGQADRPLGPTATVGAVQAYEVYNAIITGKPYPVKGMLSLGGNLLLSNGDSLKGKDALELLDFHVQAELFQNPASRTADILLPAATCWESEHVRTSFDGGSATSCHVQLRQQVVPPLHESWPDMKIIFELAKRLGLADKFWQGDIEAGFNYQLKPLGITVEDLRNKPRGISLPLPLKYKKYAESRKGVATPTGKMEIYSQTFLNHGHDPLPVYKESEMSLVLSLEGPVNQPDISPVFPLTLTSAKLHQFCHTQHRNIPMLRKLVPYPFLEINPEKAKELSVAEGDWVILETPQGSIKLKARLAPGIDPRVVCTQHGWYQACTALSLPGFDPFSKDGANVNMLISNEAIDPISGSVPHRSYPCQVRKA